jgi:hypothetical protein
LREKCSGDARRVDTERAGEEKIERAAYWSKCSGVRRVGGGENPPSINHRASRTLNTHPQIDCYCPWQNAYHLIGSYNAAMSIVKGKLTLLE